MTLSRLLPTLLVLMLLALAGCGGDDEESDSGSSGSDDAATVYSDAIKQLDQLKSGKLDAKLDTVLRLGNEQTISVAEKATFSGEGGTSLPQFELQINVEQSGGQPQDTAAVNTGEDFFVRENGATEFKSQGKQAVDQLTQAYEREQSELEPGRIPLLSLTPSDWAKSPKAGGTEEFDGVTVEKITAEVDVPKFLKDLEVGKNSDIGMGVELTKDARQLLEPGADVEKAELVALIGEEDGKLRRLTATVDGNVAGGVEVDFDVQLTEVDKPQEITAP